MMLHLCLATFAYFSATVPHQYKLLTPPSAAHFSTLRILADTMITAAGPHHYRNTAFSAADYTLTYLSDILYFLFFDIYDFFSFQLRKLGQPRFASILPGAFPLSSKAHFPACRCRTLR